MQSELPWNVAGIPAEAREAARAAARREGLSVGEWMTRRILRGFGDAVMEANAGWRPSLVESAPATQPEPVHSLHESEEMLAHVSRSEAEAQNAYKALDQQLRTVARRLETAERNQTENNRAMTQAATQINIAAREQAQAFDQMAANVTVLAERLARLERQAQSDGLKDAVKALHQGLSRLADQIAQTANQSAAQIAALAGNVDSLTTQVVEAHDRAGVAAQGMKALGQVLETRLASMDERLRVAERTAFSSASALDHTMENVERLRALKDTLEEEIHQQVASAGQMKDTFDQLNERVSAGEVEQQASAARMEEAIARLEAQASNAPFEDRVKGIEHTLSEITQRVEYAEYSNASTTAKVEQTLHELSAGFETADRRNRETIAELEIALRDANAKIAAVEDKVSAPPAAAEAAQMTAEATAKPPPMEAAPEATPPKPAQPILDMPPFAENMFEPEMAPDFLPLPEEHHDLPAMADVTADLPPSAYDFENVFTPDVSPPAFGDALFAEPSPDSFIAAARHSANAAAAQPEQARDASMGGLAWAFTGKAQSKTEKESGKRYALAASIFGVAVTAALAGVVLSRGIGSQPPMHAPAAIITPYAHATSPQPALSPGRSTEPDTSADEAAAPVSAAPKAAASAPGATAAAALPKAAAQTPASSSPAQAAKAPAALPAAAPAAAAAQAPQFEKLAALAKSGDSKGQLLLGLKYLEGSGVTVNEAEAARWLARAAQQGEPFAQYRLGTLYERGRGVAADAKLAAHWYQLAAKQGNRKAMHNLAVSFAEGSGEPKDPVQAAMWFARAANCGLADSQFNLAVLYERGMGVKQSLTDAYKWYLIAAAQGDSESKSRADALSTQLSDADRAAAQQAAASFRPQQLNPAANSIPVLG